MNHSQAPPELLESAAALIERVIKQLNTKGVKCKACGSAQHENITETRAHERLQQMPERLRQTAARLREDITAARRGAKGHDHATD